MSYEDDTEVDMTVEDFAKWLLDLPDDIKAKKIWFIDVTMPYKNKPLNIEHSPTKTHVSFEDCTED